MMPRVLSLVLTVFIATFSFAQEKAPKLYLTVFTHDNLQAYPHDRDVLQSFNDNANLATVKAGTVFNHYTAKDKLYELRFSKSIPESSFPTVLLQYDDGGVIYKASGPNMPIGAELYTEMKKYADMDPRRNVKNSLAAPEITDYSDCPDSRCPIPVKPNPRIDIPVNLVPDSVELFNLGSGSGPVRNTLSVVVISIGAIVGLFLILIMCVLLVGAMVIVWNVITSSNSNKGVRK